MNDAASRLVNKAEATAKLAVIRAERSIRLGDSVDQQLAESFLAGVNWALSEVNSAVAEVARAKQEIPQ